MQKIIYIILAGALITTVFGMKKINQRSPRINHIALAVKDLGISTAFYRDIISLDTIPEPFHDGKHTWFTMGDRSQLHLIEAPVNDDEKNKNNHLCFSIENMDAFIERLEKEKVSWGNWPGDEKKITIRPDGVKQIYFQDPDGNWLEINNDDQ